MCLLLNIVQSGNQNRNLERATTKYWDVKKQVSFCQLFLHYLGCKSNKTSNNNSYINDDEKNNLYFDFND